MTTNATLLADDTIDWLDAHRFGLSISIDGPKAIHDRNRLTVGGQGHLRDRAAQGRAPAGALPRAAGGGRRVTLTTAPPRSSASGTTCSTSWALPKWASRR